MGGFSFWEREGQGKILEIIGRGAAGRRGKMEGVRGLMSGW